jgi:hypothetical protein
MNPPSDHDMSKVNPSNPVLMTGGAKEIRIKIKIRSGNPT